MNIEELLKDLAPVTIIEFKNYLIEIYLNYVLLKTLILKLLLNLEMKKNVAKNMDVSFIKMEKLRLVVN